MVHYAFRRNIDDAGLPIAPYVAALLGRCDPPELLSATVLSQPVHPLVLTMAEMLSTLSISSVPQWQRSVSYVNSSEPHR